MSKYSHFEMSEKIFGNRYKWDNKKQDLVPYSRTDMWDKLLEQQKENKQLKEQLEEKDKKIIKFIEELAWCDAQYDAMQSTMGDIPASRSAIPNYAKRYFNFWKELFNENLEQAKESLK